MTAHHDERAGGRDGLTGLLRLPLPVEAALGPLLESGPIRRQKRRPVAGLLFAIDEPSGAAAHRTVREALLRSLATVLRQALRPADLAFRRDDDRVLVLRPGTSLLGAWLWAEEVSLQYARLWEERGGLEGPARLSIGAVSFPAQECGCEMVDLAEAALHLARRDGGGTLRTWDWVEVDSALQSVQSTNLDPEGRRRQFIERCDYLLGPVQRRDLNEHCAEVSAVSVHLARLLGLDDALLEQIRLAGLLHDLGKAVIPEELLARPGSLSHREWALMSAHAAFGAELAERYLGVGPWTGRCIRHHHSRYDAIDWAEEEDQEVPLGARVLCVADALVAMTSLCPYREAVDAGVAMSELARGSGGQFDPRVVAAARRLPQKARWTLAA